MQIESKELKEALIEVKEGIQKTLAMARKNKVRDVLIANISIIESVLLWVHKTEKEGVTDMESLKIGLGKTVKLADMLKSGTGSRSQLDRAIIEEAEHLKDGQLGDARPIDRGSIKNVTYFKNRVYQLARDGKIHALAAPKETPDGNLYIWLTEKQKGRNKKAKETAK